ncbi:MAG: ATP-binding cassette, subfamily, partial [Marmoricola sp.]|nr:ATP-binding cassette, subfamily [Marmoricola sp.]
MSAINPGTLMRTMRRDPSVVEQKLTRETVRRIAGFAVPHKRLIAVFLVFVVLD